MKRQALVEAAAEAQRFIEMTNQLLRGTPLDDFVLLLPFGERYLEQSRWLTHKINRAWESDRAAVETAIEVARKATEAARNAGMQAPTAEEQGSLVPSDSPA